MTESDKKLILDLSLEKINIDDFFQDYSNQVDSNHVLQLINEAYSKKDYSELEYSLLLGFKFETFSNDYGNVLNKLIQEDWHFKHEDLALILQDLKLPESVDPLYVAALKRLDYLNYDDSFAVARKCIHALGDIGTEAALEKLKQLSNTNIAIIKEKVEKQLNYYRK